ncbi:hypothetical protein [Chryseosolibacter indicus]|uniref:Uncharacterized protein n=1 Tax=Chryseosolibacter indicus TaxID=2782351 RepID=A0ABS5VY73_9BACT|nr:hypothetical protein [Chryseosolibacter indicus]MBT1706353.1 hypothetical protein [Chryseosolibacter indicus]
MKKTYILTIALGAVLVIASEGFAQERTDMSKSESTRMDSLSTAYQKEQKDEALIKELKNEHKDTKEKAKEAKRVEREANNAAKESKNALRAEKKAQKARDKANKQAQKATKARERADKN